MRLENDKQLFNGFRCPDDRDYATAEWLVEQGVPFYKEITRGNVKILIASQLPALPPGWKRPS